MQLFTSKSNPTFILFSLFSIKRHCRSLPIKKRRCRWVMSSLGNVVLYDPQNSPSVCGMKNSFPLKLVVERLKLVPLVALWPHSASFTGLRSCKIRVYATKGDIAVRPSFDNFGIPAGIRPKSLRLKQNFGKGGQCSDSYSFPASNLHSNVFSRH